MKSFLLASLSFAALASPALAADLPARMPVKAAAVVRAYNWTGAYAGINGGYGWANGSVNGGFAGGQLGYNWQMPNNLVFGIETDAQWSGMRGTQTIVEGADINTDTHKLTWFGTTRGRLGLAFDRFLPYVTGGVAYGQRKSDGTVSGGATGTYSVSSTKAGWTVGAGIDGAITNNWSWRLEYLHVSLPAFSSTVTLPASTETIEYNRLDSNMVRAALNYRFAP